MEVPQKIKSRITISFQQSPSWAYFTDKTLIQKDTCTLVFIAALFTISKTWKQPKCPMTDEWMKEEWYIYTVEYYSAIKTDKTMPLAATWMDLEMIILSQANLKKKNTI